MGYWLFDEKRVICCDIFYLDLGRQHVKPVSSCYSVACLLDFFDMLGCSLCCSQGVGWMISVLDIEISGHFRISDIVV